MAERTEDELIKAARAERIAKAEDRMYAALVGAGSVERLIDDACACLVEIPRLELFPPVIQNAASVATVARRWLEANETTPEQREAIGSATARLKTKYLEARAKFDVLMKARKESNGEQA